MALCLLHCSIVILYDHISLHYMVQLCIAQYYILKKIPLRSIRNVEENWRKSLALMLKILESTSKITH